MKWIGLTGGMGTGKSTVAAILQTLGYPVLNADKNAQAALQKNSGVYSEIVKAFGDKILNSAGEIDRKTLAGIVFNDKFMLTKLESITHPYIQGEVQKEKDLLTKKGVLIAFYDVPLLFEKKLEKRFDKIVTVICKKELQIQRAMERTKLSEDEVKQRLAHQIAPEVKAKHSHYVLRNDGTIEELQMKIQDLILSLKKDLKIV
jgi:dephospho-CoA kinase